MVGDCMNLKDRYAIVGVGYTPQGRIPDRTLKPALPRLSQYTFFFDLF